MARLGIFLSTAMLMACTNTVVDSTGSGGDGSGGETSGGGAGGHGAGGEGASNPTNSGAGGCGIDCPPTEAIVYQNAAPPPETSGSTGSSGQTVASTSGGPDYNAVHLQLSDYGEQCAAAYELLPCGGFTRYTLSFPEYMLTPGTVYLSDPEVWLSTEETGPGEDCSFGGGGGFEEGQLQIFSVDGDTVTGALSGLPYFGAYDPNGQFVATLCF